MDGGNNQDALNISKGADATIGGTEAEIAKANLVKVVCIPTRRTHSVLFTN